MTSFNDKLYRATGYRLLKTHRRHSIKEKLLITFEGLSQEEIISDPHFLFFDLQHSAMLHQWLLKFQEYIPLNLGGKAKKCNCVIKEEKDKWFGHKQGCPHSEWNRRASQWFRKIVSLAHALELTPKKIIFLDCDVMFQQNITLKTWNGIFSKHGIIYHQGPYRNKSGNGIESGVIGFQEVGGGYDYLRNVINCFLSGEFLKYKRWDDGYIFRMILDKTPKEKLARRDMVVWERKTSHVVNLGLLRSSLRHDKGHHLKKYKIV